MNVGKAGDMPRRRVFTARAAAERLETLAPARCKEFLIEAETAREACHPPGFTRG
jgi:hypothetical protein